MAEFCSQVEVPACILCKIKFWVSYVGGGMKKREELGVGFC